MLSCPVHPGSATIAGLILLIRTVSPAQSPPIELVDLTEESGIGFRHHTGATGRKYMPETMGSGVVWQDYDVDGDWDLYLVDSGPLPGAGPAAAEGPDAASLAGQEGRPPGANALYRNEGAGRFRRVLAGAEDRGYGLGATVGDYDADGWPDLLVTNYGDEALYRNNGDGSFSDVTAVAGVGDERLSSSAAWGDLDNDGELDLYIANYARYDLADAPECFDPGRGVRAYCHPRILEGQIDQLYRNRGDGTFERVDAEPLRANRFEGKGLGVVMSDLDDDGLLDIYVANDTTRNFLYDNHGGFRFEDVALFAGVGFSDTGRAQAGMGVDVGDLDGDGAFEITVTNFSGESNNLYRPVAPGVWADDTDPMGLGDPSRQVLGFGVVMVDLDGDGALDVGVANGHIQDTVTEAEDGTSYEQPNQIFRNRLPELRAAAVAAGELRPPADELPPPAGEPPPPAGAEAAGIDERSAGGATGWRPSGPLLVDVSEAVGPAVTRRRVSRGMAVGDADGDGWPDLAVTNSDGPAELLRNASRTGHRRVVLRLRGRETNRDGYGARVWITPAGGYEQVHESRSASSYLSQNANELYVGLGPADAAHVEVRWPGGERQRIGRIEAGQVALIVEGRGLVATRPFVASDRAGAVEEAAR